MDGVQNGDSVFHNAYAFADFKLRRMLTLRFRVAERSRCPGGGSRLLILAGLGLGA
jgi:hypothetical protein